MSEFADVKFPTDDDRLEEPAPDAGISSVNHKELTGALKPPMHLVPQSANVVESLVLRHGAEKHKGAYNWRKKGVKLTTYIGAAMRHLAALNDGEDDDPETKLPHAAHVRACMSIILDAEHVGKLEDDREHKGASAEVILKHTRAL